MSEYLITKHQKLSEEFIEKWRDKVDWEGISCNRSSWRCLLKSGIRKWKLKFIK